MRLIAGAVFAALVLAGTAVAQPTEAPAPATTPAAPPAVTACGALPPAPTGFPDGASATPQQMAAANATFTTWMTATTEGLACRRDEASAAIARATSLRDQFNDANASVGATRTSWATEVEEFNARTSRGR